MPAYERNIHVSEVGRWIWYSEAPLSMLRIAQGIVLRGRVGAIHRSKVQIGGLGVTVWPAPMDIAFPSIPAPCSKGQTILPDVVAVREDASRTPAICIISQI